VSPDKRDAGEASSANERGLENYAAFSGVTSASSTLGFSVSDGVRSTGGRSLERRNIEFKTLTIPDGGLRYRSACLFDQLRTSPTRSQIPNTNRTDTIRKMHQSEAGIADAFITPPTVGKRIELLCGNSSAPLRGPDAPIRATQDNQHGCEEDILGRAFRYSLFLNCAFYWDQCKSGRRWHAGAIAIPRWCYGNSLICTLIASHKANVMQEDGAFEPATFCTSGLQILLFRGEKRGQANSYRNPTAYPLVGQRRRMLNPIEGLPRYYSGYTERPVSNNRNFLATCYCEIILMPARRSSSVLRGARTLTNPPEEPWR